MLLLSLSIVVLVTCIRMSDATSYFALYGDPACSQMLPGSNQTIPLPSPTCTSQLIPGLDVYVNEYLYCSTLDGYLNFTYGEGFGPAPGCLAGAQFIVSSYAPATTSQCAPTILRVVDESPQQLYATVQCSADVVAASSSSSASPSPSSFSFSPSSSASRASSSSSSSSALLLSSSMFRPSSSSHSGSASSSSSRSSSSSTSTSALSIGHQSSTAALPNSTLSDNTQSASNNSAATAIAVIFGVLFAVAVGLLVYKKCLATKTVVVSGTSMHKPRMSSTSAYKGLVGGNKQSGELHTADEEETLEEEELARGTAINDTERDQSRLAEELSDENEYQQEEEEEEERVGGSRGIAV